MLNIAMVTTCYHPVINGVVRMIELYREHLTQIGHRVTVFTFGPPSPQDGRHTVRIPAVPLGKTGYYARFRFPKPIIEQLNRMDVVHCHHLFMGPELLAGRIKPPLIYTNHTRYDLYTAVYLPLPGVVSRPVANRLIGRLWPRNTAGCAGVIAPSNHIAAVMRSFGVTAPISVIHNGIELSTFAPTVTNNRPDETLTGVYVGRLAAEKNVRPLLAGLINVCHRNRNVRFRLIGHGSLYRDCQRKIAAAQLEKRIILEGWVPKAAIPSLLAEADFQVTMSVSEVHPLGIIEGMAAGLPTVALYDVAMSECVGSAGLLAHTAADWVKQVQALIDSADLRQTLGENAGRQAATYGIERTVAETVELYHKLRNGKKL